ncbi:MAG: succinate dehydrogenase/fumarate reductase iron-sulfur subunit [Spirochaetia bacterium]
MDKVTLNIYRFDPYRDQTPAYSEYSLDYNRNDQLLDLFERIKTEIDSTFAYRRSCRHGICGSCAVKVAGKPVLACRTPVRLLTAEFGPLLTVSPLDESRVIHDLVSNMDGFWAKHEQVTPFLVPTKSLPNRSVPAASLPAGGTASDSHSHRTFETRFFDSSSAAAGDSDYCIQCGACYYVCPVVSVQPEFLGPAAITKAYRFIHDPRDTFGGRLQAVAEPGRGVWECIKCLKCTEVCPKHIDPFLKISRLHSAVFHSSSFTQNSRIRHTRGFQLDLMLNGLLNELPLALYALRAGFVKMGLRGIKMILHGKVVLNPFRPRSKAYRQIRKLMRNSQ